MKREQDGTAILAVLALAASLASVLFSTLACVYTASYAENARSLATSIDRLSAYLEGNGRTTKRN
jgi:hypothetical protein